MTILEEEFVKTELVYYSNASFVMSTELNEVYERQEVEKKWVSCKLLLNS